jgi:hypothetical protein
MKVFLLFVGHPAPSGFEHIRRFVQNRGGLCKGIVHSHAGFAKIFKLKNPSFPQYCLFPS